MKKRHQQKLIILAFALFAVFNMPLLLIFDKNTLIFGLPLIYLNIFFFWLFGIFLSWLIVKKYYE